MLRIYMRVEERTDVLQCYAIWGPVSFERGGLAFIVDARFAGYSDQSPKCPLCLICIGFALPYRLENSFCTLVQYSDNSVVALPAVQIEISV